MTERGDGGEVSAQERDWFTIAVRIVVAVVVVAGWGVYFATQDGWMARLPFGNGKTFRAPAAAEQARQNSIAFTRADGTIALISPEDREVRVLGKSNALFPSVAWSHDGRYLSYVDRNARGTSSVVITPANRDEPRVFYRDPGMNVIYHAWSPNDNDLAILGRGDASVEFYIVPREEPKAARLIGGAPSCFFTWRPDGEVVLANLGNMKLAVLDTVTGEESLVVSAMTRYQTPAWPTDDAFYYLQDSGGRNEIRRGDGVTLETESVSEGPWSCKLVASPNGKYIAYVDSPLADFMPLSSRRPGVTHIVDVNAGTVQSIDCDKTYAFFWSPDSTKLMLLGRVGGLEAPVTENVEDVFPPIGNQEQMGVRWHRWWLYDLTTGACTPLVQCRMTRSFLQTLPFFDQMSINQRFWSPDSRYFVIAARKYDEHPGDIWVLDTQGHEPPRLLTDGSMAVWSWR